MNTTKEKELSDSLLAACLAAGIEEPRYIMQDMDGDVIHSCTIREKSPNGSWWSRCREYGKMTMLDHPPYADDWRDSLLEWVDPQGEPLADVLARHPEHIADTSKMIEVDPYKVQIGGVTLDPYMIASLYQINDPIIFQMLKKLLRLGRKHKSESKDVVECITSGIRWLEINSPDDAVQFKKGGEKL